MAAPADVRRATDADVDAFTAHRLAIFRETQGLADDAAATLAAATRAAFAALLASGSTSLWLAWRDGAAVGSVALHVFARFPSPTNPCASEGYVSHVWVAATCRRQGVGTALLRALLADADARGLRRIRLHATADGRGLYETLGFRLRSNDMERLL